MPQSALIRAFRIPEQLLNSPFRLNSTREADTKSLPFTCRAALDSHSDIHISSRNPKTHRLISSPLCKKNGTRSVWDEWDREIGPKKRRQNWAKSWFAILSPTLVAWILSQSVGSVTWNCKQVRAECQMFSGHSSPSFCFWLDSPEVPCNSSWTASYSQNQPE